jgi:hypothetical protein
MSGDYKLEDSVYILFTTRAFATGIPGVLSAATVAVYEDVTSTPIETSIAVTETLNSINGLNAVTIAALAASGYNAGGHYHVVIEAGTVDSVSVVGEVVGNFSIQSAPVNWAKVSAPTTAVDLSATDIQLVDTVTVATDAEADIAALNDITAASVWAVDATGEQDAGSFGLAIGDPGASAETIWKSLHTDAAGDAISDDIKAIKTVVDAGATTIELDKVPKSDGTVSWNATALTAIEDEIWDAVLTGAAHNTATTAGRRLRLLELANSYGGQIHVDTVNGVAGTTFGEHGVPDVPVNLWASAITLSTGGDGTIHDFHVINGSAITLAESNANRSIFGDHYTLALGGQACGGLYCQGATVSGAGTSAGEEMHFEGCDFVAASTVEQGHFDKCGFASTQTWNTADDYDYHGCYSKGNTAPIFLKNQAAATIVAEFVDYHGDITIGDNSTGDIQSGDTVELGGFFRTITLSGDVGSTIHVHGHYQTIVSSNFDGTLDITGAIQTADVAAILADTADIQPSYATEAKQDTAKTAIDAIKTETDKFVFTNANELDVNTKSINDAEVIGDGNATPWDGV